MFRRYPGGFITNTPVAPTTSESPGIWTIDQAMMYIKAGTWPVTTDVDSSLVEEVSSIADSDLGLTDADSSLTDEASALTSSAPLP